MLSALMCVLVAFAAGPGEPAAQKDSATVPTLGNIDGIWPTPVMIEGLLGRWVAQTAADFDLEESQRTALLERFRARWQPFLREHRSRMQPLLNEFLEVRLAATPPDASVVKAWADRAAPVLQLFQEEFTKSQEDMREVFRADQRAKLARKSLEMSAGLGLAHAKLDVWRRGQFELSEWWDAPAGYRDGIRAAESRGPKPPGTNSLQAAPSPAKKRIDEELLRWDAYVEKFIKMYHLNRRQGEAAYSILRECKGRAIDHRDRYRGRMEQLEKQLTSASTLTEEHRSEIVAMYAPMDRIFDELDRRLQPIPTRVQTAAANGSAAAADGKSDSSP